MARKPTGAVLSTPSVPRKSRSPSALTTPLAQVDLQRGRDRLQRHARAGDQRFQQHVARAELRARAAGGRMQARDRQRAAGLDLAGDVLVVERALRLQRDDGGRRARRGTDPSAAPEARAVAVDSMMLFPESTTKARPPRGRARVAGMFARC